MGFNVWLGSSLDYDNVSDGDEDYVLQPNMVVAFRGAHDDKYITDSTDILNSDKCIHVTYDPGDEHNFEQCSLNSLFWGMRQGRGSRHNTCDINLYQLLQSNSDREARGDVSEAKVFMNALHAINTEVLNVYTCLVKDDATLSVGPWEYPASAFLALHRGQGYYDKLGWKGDDNKKLLKFRQKKMRKVEWPYYLKDTYLEDFKQKRLVQEQLYDDIDEYIGNHIEDQILNMFTSKTLENLTKSERYAINMMNNHRERLYARNEQGKRTRSDNIYDIRIRDALYETRGY